MKERTQKQEKTDREIRLEWARGCQKATTTKHVLSLARSRLPLDPDVFDSDPWLLNCPNGTIDLRTGELHPHRPEDMQTMMTATRFDPAIKAPLWSSFLHRIFGGSAELIHFMQKAAGYSLTGITSEQILFMLYGNGQNGKSTFTGMLTEALGDYGKALPRGLLSAQKFEGHPTILADLFRARMTVSSEVKADMEWDEERVKHLTGGDKIKARRMGEDFWEFTPTHKIFLAANHQPATKDNSQGFWRRLRLIPFTVTIPEKEKDPKLTEKLRAELPGILAWAVEGCMKWRAEGLESPNEVLAATRDYRERQDPFGRFLTQYCDTNDREARVQATALHKAYEAWARENHEASLSTKELAGVLLERGFQVRKASSNFYLGLCLKDS